MLEVLGSCSATPTSFMYSTNRSRICDAKGKGGEARLRAGRKAHEAAGHAAEDQVEPGAAEPQSMAARSMAGAAPARVPGTCSCPAQGGTSGPTPAALGEGWERRRGTHLGQGVVACVGHAALGALVLDDLRDGWVVAEGDGGEQVVLHLQVQAACREGGGVGWGWVGGVGWVGGFRVEGQQHAGHQPNKVRSTMQRQRWCTASRPLGPGRRVPGRLAMGVGQPVGDATAATHR